MFFKATLLALLHETDIEFSGTIMTAEDLEKRAATRSGGSAQTFPISIFAYFREEFADQMGDSLSLHLSTLLIPIEQNVKTRSESEAVLLANLDEPLTACEKRSCVGSFGHQENSFAWESKSGYHVFYLDEVFDVARDKLEPGLSRSYECLQRTGTNSHALLH
jgi:hypothetical protein